MARWLIATDHQEGYYWRVRPGMHSQIGESDNQSCWVTNPDDALCFARRGDAEAYIAATLLSDVRAIEYVPEDYSANVSKAKDERVSWAEGLIRQLPEDHDGRNSWLLNYSTKPDAVAKREECGIRFPFSLSDKAPKTFMGLPLVIDRDMAPNVVEIRARPGGLALHANSLSIRKITDDA